jgi:hypothetical protein
MANLIYLLAGRRCTAGHAGETGEFMNGQHVNITAATTTTATTHHRSSSRHERQRIGRLLTAACFNVHSL